MTTWLAKTQISRDNSTNYNLWLNLRNNGSTSVYSTPLAVLNNYLKLMRSKLSWRDQDFSLLLRWVVQSLILLLYFWKKSKLDWGGRGRVLQARHQQLGIANLTALFWSRTVPLLLLTHQARPLYPPNSQPQSHQDTAFSPFSSVGYTIAPIRSDRVSVALLHHAFIIHLAQCQRPLENSQNPDIRHHMILGFLICT